MLPSGPLLLPGSDRVPVDRETQPGAAEQGAWARPIPERIGEAVVALAVLGTALFFIWQAALLPFGGIALPGPAFFPFALGIALGLLALVILSLSLLGKMAGAGAVYLGHRDVLIAFAALVGVAATFEQADTYVTLGVFAAVLLVFVARAQLWRVALGATLGMLGVALVFRFALGVRLPAGEYWRQALDMVVARLPAGSF